MFQFSKTHYLNFLGFSSTFVVFLIDVFFLLFIFLDLIKELSVSEEMHLKQCDAKLQEELKKAEANLASCAMLKHRLDEW